MIFTYSTKESSPEEQSSMYLKEFCKANYINFSIVVASLVSQHVKELKEKDRNDKR
jgi:hypothetical protein